MAINFRKESPLIVGREKEIGELLKLLDDVKSAALILGESGIGKSALLEEIHKILWNDHRNKLLVGFYDESKVSISASLLYPFVITLKSLLDWASHTDTDGNEQRTAEIVIRLKNALGKFIKEKGFDLAKAIIYDISKNFGFEKTLDIISQFPEAFDQEKTRSKLAYSYVADHTNEVISSYIKIFESLAEEFKDHDFALTFDKFESTSKQSIDFLRDFIHFMPNRFHVIVSFKEEKLWIDEVDKKLYEHIEEKFTELTTNNQLNVQIVKLQGISAEAIGEWIKIVRNKTLRLDPDLRIIREYSGGFPILLSEWINKSQSLDYIQYERIDRRRPCESYLVYKRHLSHNDIVKLNQMTVLLQPIPSDDLAELLQMRLEELDPLMSTLIQHNIFVRKNHQTWFRHELIQVCLKKDLDEDTKKLLHENAAEFFLRKYIDNANDDIINYATVGFAYHLYKAGNRNQDSYIQNELVARTSTLLD